MPKSKSTPRLKKLYRLFSRREKIKTIGLFCLMVVNALAEMVSIGAIPAFILVVASPEKVMAHPVSGPLVQWLGIETSRELLVTGSVSLILLFVLKGALVAFIGYVRIRFVQHKYLELSGRLFAGYMLAPYVFHLNRNTSGLLRNLLSESHNVVHGVFMNLLGVALNLVSMVFIITLLVLIEPFFTLIALGLLGSITWFMMKMVDKKMGFFGKQEMEHRQVSNKVVLEGLAGIKDARVLGREESFMAQFEVSNWLRAQSQFFKEMVRHVQRPLMEVITVVGVLGLALVLTTQDQSIESIVAVLALFAAATYRMMPTFRDLINQANDLRYHIVSIDPVYDDIEQLQHKLEERAKPGSPVVLLKNEIVLENISYAYPEQEKPVLQNVGLTIPRGVAIALVGESGAGKTTLVDVLLGLLTPQSGTIKVDDCDINKDLRAWQHNIGYIPQFIYLSDDTLKRNVAFGLNEEDIDDDRFWAAANAARLTGLITELPEKENTVIGERGVRLSGGQRQRIGIARALYHNPQLLIMDEGTSALDNITEKFVIDAIERLKGNRTIIMIAHRLSTVRNCDVIYLMEQGRITDSGSYDELLERNPMFRKMAGEK